MSYNDSYTPDELNTGTTVTESHLKKIGEGIARATEIAVTVGNDLEDVKNAMPTLTGNVSDFENDANYAVAGEITPEMTTFAKRGKNLWDGKWYKMAISGPSNSQYTIIASTNGRCAIFEAEPWKAYTISRGEKGNRYGVACMKTFPTVGATIDRLVSGQVSSAWTTKTVVMGGDEHYIIVYTTNEGVDEENFQIEVGRQFTGYSPYNAVQINIEEEYKETEKNVVWFGDSISELRELPHRVAAILNYNIMDCSFAGSGYSTLSNANYTALSFRELSKAIVSCDFTAQQTAADNIKNDTSVNSSDKQPNLDTLKAVDWSTIDEAVVFLGTNDYGSQVTIGDGVITTDSEGTITNEDEFKVSIKIGIENILSVNPAIQFKFVLPMWRGDTAKSKPLTDYITAIKEVLAPYHFPIYDTYNNNGINEFNASVFMNPDMLHPSSDGDSLLSKKISSFIKNY